MLCGLFSLTYWFNGRNNEYILWSYSLWTCIYCSVSLLLLFSLFSSPLCYKTPLSIPTLSRDSSVGIATGYGPDGRGIGVRFATGERELFIVHSVQTGSGAHPAYTIQWVPRALSRGVKQTTHLRLVRRLRMLGAMLPYPDDVHHYIKPKKLLLTNRFYFQQTSGVHAPVGIIKGCSLPGRSLAPTKN
jgi:hypothetical protein